MNNEQLLHAQDGSSALASSQLASTGVYVGCVWQEYHLLLQQLAVPSSISILTGSGLNFTVGRVSYTFSFQGAKFCRIDLELLVSLAVSTCTEKKNM